MRRHIWNLSTNLWGMMIEGVYYRREAMGHRDGGVWLVNPAWISQTCHVCGEQGYAWRMKPLPQRRREESTSIVQSVMSTFMLISTQHGTLCMFNNPSPVPFLGVQPDVQVCTTYNERFIMNLLTDEYYK
jgi:hypothetical protein